MNIVSLHLEKSKELKETEKKTDLFFFKFFQFSVFEFRRKK